MSPFLEGDSAVSTTTNVAVLTLFHNIDPEMCWNTIEHMWECAGSTTLEARHALQERAVTSGGHFVSITGTWIPFDHCVPGSHTQTHP